MRTLNRMKLAQLVKEFNFLSQLPGYDLDYCQHVAVKRAGREEMERKPFQHTTITDQGTRSRGDYVLLLSDTGAILGTVKPTQYTINYQDNGRESFAHGDTILESIFKQGLARKLAFIVWINYGQESTQDLTSKSWYTTIYKPTNPETIEEALTSALTEAQAEVEELKAVLA